MGDATIPPAFQQHDDFFKLASGMQHASVCLATTGTQQSTAVSARSTPNSWISPMVW